MLRRRSRWIIDGGLMINHEQINQIQLRVHRRYLAAIRLYRFAQSRLFEEAYAISSPNEKMEAASLLEKLDCKGMQDWARRILKIYNLYELLPMRELREFAKELHIPNYATKTKLELISEINYERTTDTTNRITTWGNETAYATSGKRKEMEQNY